MNKTGIRPSYMYTMYIRPLLSLDEKSNGKKIWYTQLVSHLFPSRKHISNVGCAHELAIIWLMQLLKFLPVILVGKSENSAFT